MSMHIHTGTPPFVTGALARVERCLPHPGKIVARIGQRVEPEDIVAKCFVPGTPKIINVARTLMINPDRVERAMQLEVGNKVSAGDVLARIGRISRHVCLAPVSGEIVHVDQATGYVTIIPDPQPYELRANVRGVVMEEIPAIGVRIETPAAQVFGVFGFGEERSGVLHLLVTDPSDMILPEMIDARSAYAIVIGGSGITAEALRRAVMGNVRAIIIGSIDEAELRAFLGWESISAWRTGSRSWQLPAVGQLHDVGLTLIVTEGFGQRPMANPLFELLASHNRHEAFVEGTTRLRGPLYRPRVVIPLSTRTPGLKLETPGLALTPGSQVRMLDHDHLGQIAQVRAVPTLLRRLPSKVRVAAVDVQFDDSQTALVPRSAVEVLS